MTNEKLCTLIQQGQKEYLADLWEQTRRFGAMQARRYFISLGNLGGVELADLLQCRWIALLQAVRYFRAETLGVILSRVTRRQQRRKVGPGSTL